MEKKKTKGQIICDAICGILMLVALIVFLILGATIGWWHPGWIIIVSAAFVCGLIGIISNTIASLNDVNKKDEPSEKE